MSENNPAKITILFGSHAKGYARTDSDVDIAVLPERRPLTLDEKLRVVQSLKGRSGIPRGTINLVDLQTASPLLQHEIAETGKLLEGTEHDFTRFRVRAWKRYQDSVKFRTLRARRLRQTYA